MKKLIILLATSFFLISGCTVINNQKDGLPPIKTANTYINDQYNFSIQYPDDLAPTSTFQVSYIVSDAWSLLASPTGTGDKIVAFVVSGSNNITSAELRIGANRDQTEVSKCTKAPDFVIPNVKNVTINGTNFIDFEWNDAAMSHYNFVRAYRTVKNNVCIAVELFVAGTNPQVYDPPATPPFTQDYAFAQLEKILQTLTFH
ncbi:MAG: hypothetical protein WC768_00125 [Patescibacteria group bacterium]|jgi:hypothetical protein